MRLFAAVPVRPPDAVAAALQADGWSVVVQQPDGTGRSLDGQHQLVTDASVPAEPTTWVVVRSVPEVQAAAARGHQLWLRGRGCGGVVGDATALVLIRAAEQAGASWVAEGLGVRGAAAALAVGAAGLVLDGLLWRCEDLGLPTPWREALQRARSPRDTSLVGELSGPPARLLFIDPRQRATLDGLSGPERLRRLQASPADAPWLPAPALAPLGEPVGLVEACRSLRDAVAERLAACRAHHPLRSDPFGTGHPVVQGPMANVAERLGLARAVAAAGALPFVALGALAPPAAEAVLSEVDTLDTPWGAGVIGFEVMPHRDAHLDALAARGPRPVILAGGSIALARRVADTGLVPWLHTPDPALVRAACEAELPAVVLEGHEAGGHVGSLPSDVLWEACLAELERAPHRPLVVMAGGIGDAVSAAFAAAMATGAHQQGSAVALQAGTAFLLTHEALEHGQVTAAYQEAALAAARTELVGSTVNLPLRCVPSPYVREAQALEASWRAEGLPLSQRRARMEAHNLGRARLAAKGIERHPDWGRVDSAPHYRPVDRHRQREEAAFTVGQGASVTGCLATVAEVVARLSTLAADRLQGDREAFSAHGPPRSVPGTPTEPGRHSPSASSPRPRPAGRPEPLAVVSLGCVLPGAADIPSFWENLMAGVDAVGPIPAERWPAGRYVGDGVDQSITHAAGSVALDFDPLDFRIPPRAAPTMDRAQKLALLAAREAVQRAPWLRRVDRRRAAVVLGNSMGGEHSNHMAVRVRYRTVLDAMAADPLASGWTSGDLDDLAQRVAARLDERLPPIDVESMAGLLGNVIAGRVASWLDWMGGNLTVDAACAASLAAVTVAADWLRSGRCDVVLTGGVDADLSPETFAGFCRTHALSPTGSSPFSADADGFVMGEGAAVLALTRLSDARARQLPIWATIEGVGVASDGRSKGITAPKAEAQGLAIRRALEEAGVGPEVLGAVEAHGTGTKLGDATEARALGQRLGDLPHRVWLGSVKSNLGHLKGGAGAAGLTRAVLSVATGSAPPTLHAGPVQPELELPRSVALPRRPVALQAPAVGVSAFGFGGTDFHVVVGPRPEGAQAPADAEELPRSPGGPAVCWGLERAPLVLCYGAATEAELLAAVRADRPVAPDTAADHAARLAVVVDGPAARRQALDRATRWLATRGEAAALGAELHAGTGAPPPLVWAFPGQGAQRAGALLAATALFPGARAVDALGEPGGRTPWAWEASADGDALAIHLALYATGIAWSAALHDAGVPCAATTGHSLGAFAALSAAGWLPPASGCALVTARGRALAACPPGGMLAVRLDRADAEQLAEATGLSLAAINAPGSAVLAGPEPALADALQRHPDAVRLAVPRAYHSPSVEPAVAALARALSPSPLQRGPTEVWSTRTGGRTDLDALPHDLARAIADPVRFAETVRAIDAAHAGAVFVECGPGTTLTRLVHRILGSPARAVALDPGHRWGVVPGAAALWAAGHPELLAALPGTVVHRGLPAIEPVAWSRPAVGAGPAELADRARTVQDLRIAALADPSRVLAWQAARDELLTDLARHDAGQVGASRAQPAAHPAAAHPAVTRPAASPAAASPIPPAAEPLGPAPAPHDDGAQALVLGAIAEVTGYPAEFVTDSADLAEDLGVDSIRKMEILGVLEKRAGVKARDEDFAALTDAGVADLVRWVEARRSEGDPPGASLSTGSDAAAAQGPSGGATDTEAVFVVPEPTPPPEGTELPDMAPEELLAWLCATDPDALLTSDDPVSRALATGYLTCRARARGAPLPLPRWRRIHPEGGSLPDAPVVVATGGTTGIVARCLEALPGARVLFLGRREAPDPDAIARLEAHGIEVRYARCDLAEPASVRRALSTVPATWGPVQLVVHGAGAVRDGVPAEASAADRAAVLHPKLRGARALSEALGEVELWVDFTSVVGHVGNPGQALYAAANRALEALIIPARRRLSIAWTAWQEVGMASDPRLLRLLRSRGVHALPVDTGVDAFRRLIRSQLTGTVLVWARPPDDAVALPAPLSRRLSWRPEAARWVVHLDPERPALADHIVAGRPLVPAALWVDVLRAAAVDLGLSDALTIGSLDLHRATFVGQPRTAEVRVRRESTSPDAVVEAIIEVDDQLVVTARLEPAPRPATAADLEPLSDADDAACLYRPDLLFHGPTWRLLHRTRTGPGAAHAEVRAANGQPRLAELVDAAHQLLCAWSDAQAGWLGLPVGAARWQIHAPLPLDPVRMVATPRFAGEEVHADLQVVDHEGNVVLEGTDVRLRRAAGGGRG